MWGFRKMFKYEIKSCLFCFIPFSMLMSRLSGLASALASQSNVSSRENLSMSHSQRPDGSYKSCLENLTVFCVIKAGSFSLTEGFFFFLKTHWPFPKEICVLPSSKGKLWEDILEPGCVKDGSDESPLLIQILLSYLHNKIHL